jgi:glycosyltransferase involved in cell wall biosynthesis
VPKIGLDLLFLAPGETGGMETYARELVPRLPAAMPETEFVAYLGEELGAEWAGSPWHGEIEARVLPIRSATRIPRSIAEITTLHRAALRDGVDLVHGLSAAIPLAPGLTTVVTIHDLIYSRHPDTSSRLLSTGQRVLTRAVARRAQRIIAPSMATRDDLVTLLGAEPSKIDVVPEGAGRPARAVPTPEGVLRDRLGIPEGQVVLSVSARRPHKNLERLIEAVSRIPGAVLVLPGYPSPFDSELLRYARSLGVSDRVVICGWISEEDLEGLYVAATVMVFPSMAEGFGLPVLEAMSRGVPVAAADATAIPEVAGDAALLFDPASVTAIEESVRRLLADPGLRRRLSEKGPPQASSFTWGGTAAGTADSYRLALNGPSQGR